MPFPQALGPLDTQDSVVPGTRPLGYPRRRSTQVLASWLSQTPFSPGTRCPRLSTLAISYAVSSKYLVLWLSQTLFYQQMGPLAILDDAVSSRYWYPWLLQKPFPHVLGPLAIPVAFYSAGCPRRRFLQEMGPLAIPDSVSSR